MKIIENLKGSDMNEMLKHYVVLIPQEGYKLINTTNTVATGPVFCLKSTLEDWSEIPNNK